MISSPAEGAAEVREAGWPVLPWHLSPRELALRKFVRLPWRERAGLDGAHRRRINGRTYVQ